MYVAQKKNQRSVASAIFTLVKNLLYILFSQKYFIIELVDLIKVGSNRKKSVDGSQILFKNGPYFPVDTDAT